jgi:hypothetical protein
VPLTAADEPLLERFWQDYGAEFSKESATAKNELRLAKEMLRHLAGDWFMAGGLLHEGRLVAISMGEQCGSTMQVHIEKALYSYPGAYPTMVQEFARHCDDSVRWMNREDDARDKGLRMSKMQYLPAALGGKLCFEVGSELDRLHEMPTLHSDRLTLDALTEKDKLPYNALCLDEERNRLWGYDWHKDYDGSPMEEYFLSVAREDFRLRRCVNFAVGRTSSARRCCITPIGRAAWSWAAALPRPMPAAATAPRPLPQRQIGPCTAWVSPGWLPSASRKMGPPIKCSPPVCGRPARMRPISILKKPSEEIF